MRRLANRHATLNATSALGGIALLGITYLALRALPELVRYVRIRRM